MLCIVYIKCITGTKTAKHQNLLFTLFLSTEKKNIREPNKLKWSKSTSTSTNTNSECEFAHMQQIHSWIQTYQDQHRGPLENVYRHLSITCCTIVVRDWIELNGPAVLIVNTYTYTCVLYTYSLLYIFASLCANFPIHSSSTGSDGDVHFPE